MARRLVGALLIVLMAAGSVLLWISLRGDRAPARRRSMLDVVMVASVALAVLCFAVWFLMFAGSSLPTS